MQHQTDSQTQVNSGRIRYNVLLNYFLLHSLITPLFWFITIEASGAWPQSTNPSRIETDAIQEHVMFFKKTLRSVGHAGRYITSYMQLQICTHLWLWLQWIKLSFEKYFMSGKQNTNNTPSLQESVGSQNPNYLLCSKSSKSKVFI